MARKIEKKVISDDLIFGDDFDESKLAKIEAELNRPPTPEAQGGGRKKLAADGQAEPSETAADQPAASAQTEDPGRPPSSESSPEAQGQDPASSRQAAVARMVRSKRRLLAAVIITPLAITAGLVLWFATRREAPPEPQMVRHRIVVPSYRHTTSFLLFTGSLGKKKDLLRVDVELDFGSPEAYDAFKTRQVFFNDLIYKFLSKQEPADNSFEQWEKILQSDLFESLKHNHPETRLNAVQIKDFQRL